MSERNVRIAKEIYAAFGRGDVPGIMQHISDDMQHFGVVSDKKLVPWHLQISKKQDVPKFFQALAKSCEFTRFEPRDFAAGGEHVYCTVSFDVTFKHNRKKLKVDDEMHHFTFRNGKVIAWCGAEDTARIGAAYGKK